MKKINTLEDRIVQKEYEIINAEFKKAADIITKTISVYGDKFSCGEDFKASIFSPNYSAGYYIKKAHFGVGLMPKTFQDAVAKKAIEDFMENIERMNDLTSDL